MKDGRAALRYAKAILSLAKDSKSEVKVKDDMVLVVKTISENADLELLLQNPTLKSPEKIKILNKIFKNKVDNITLGLFHLLQDNNRVSLLDSIARQYAVIYDFDKHIQVAKVTTAVAITKEIEKKILEKVIAITGEKAHIENEVNSDILGGFILRVGDIQYDASISNYLNELKKEFDNSHYIPKI